MTAQDVPAEVAELNGRGYRAFQSGAAAEALALHRRALELAEDTDDPTSIVQSLAGLMRLALRDGDFEGLDDLVAQAEAVARSSDEAALRRYPLHMRAEGLRMSRRFGEARAAYEESIDLNLGLGNTTMVAAERVNLAWVAIAEGDLVEATELTARGSAGFPPDYAYGRAFVLLTNARIRLEAGDRSGASLLDEADDLLAASGLVWDPAEQPAYDETRRMVG